MLHIAAALYITGIWALFEEQPAYVFTFPSNVNDAIFHLATAVVFSIVAAIQLREDRMCPAARNSPVPRARSYRPPAIPRRRSRRS